VHGNLIGSFSLPVCNRAGLTATVLQPGWYATDTSSALVHRKPPKQAQLPDALGEASMYASKLVMRLGQWFESARRLSICRDLQVKRNDRITVRRLYLDLLMPT
jgi:hypothetical protein